MGIALLVLFVPVQGMAQTTMPEIRRSISVGAGTFSPFKGNTGPNGMVQFMFIQSNQLRIGGEIEYRDFEGEVLDVEDVDIQSFILKGLVKYYFRPEGFSPYLGGSIGFTINKIDSDKIEQKRPSLKTKKDTARGLGVMALIGFEVPLAERIAFFLEGRVSLDAQLVSIDNGSKDDDVDVENFGGLSAVGGIIFRF